MLNLIKKYWLVWFLKKLNKYLIQKIPAVVILGTLILWYFLTGKRKKLNDEKKWAFWERIDSKQDNAWALFTYAKNKNEIQSYYFYAKGNVEERIITIGSLWRYKTFLEAWVFISSHWGLTEPVQVKIFNKLFSRLIGKKKYIFLNHWVTKDDVSQFQSKKVLGADAFVTTSDKESKYVLKLFWYSENQVRTTWFPRFDYFTHDSKSNKETILCIPTRRSYINTEQEFLGSEFYKEYYTLWQLMNSFLVSKKIKLKVILHFEFEKYLRHFTDQNTDYVEFTIMQDIDLKNEIATSCCVITDYSSIWFDVGYYWIPVLYYFMDYENFRDNHYKEGYFNYETMWFGPISRNWDDLLKNISALQKNWRDRWNKYSTRIKNFFKYNDQDNSERVFNKIIALND